MKLGREARVVEVTTGVEMTVDGITTDAPTTMPVIVVKIEVGAGKTTGVEAGVGAKARVDEAVAHLGAGGARRGGGRGGRGRAQ